jgi:hypothetical protein
MNLGATNIATLKLGSQQVSRVMLGSVEVWANMDADAAAYIAAIEGDGITVSATQKSALDAFYKAGKADGWYSALKRMYLPIWAAETPNARCMVSGTSGSFVGGVTHEAGYVVGNGTTGYFEVDTTINPLGISGSNAMLVAAIKTVTTTSAALHGLRDAATARFYIGAISSTTQSFRCPVTTTVGDMNIGRSPGVLVGVSAATNLRYLVHDGGTLTDTSASTIILPNIVPFFMASNNNGSGATWFSNEHHGMYGIGTAPPSIPLAESLQSAVRTLWETCTGLTLP